MDKEERIVYFAYGSNMDLQNLERLKVKVFKIEKAILMNYKLVFNVVNENVTGAGYANIIPQSGSSVEGIMILTDKTSIQYLDKYEGFPFLYQKLYIEVFSGNNHSQEAMVYVGNPLRTEEGLKPAKDHLNHILQGKAFLSKNYWLELTQLVYFPI